MSGLEHLLAQATPGPWEANTGGSFYAAELRAPSPHNGFALIKVMTNPEADLALIALAPDAVRLLIDMAAFVQAIDDDPEEPSEIDAVALLVRFAALDQKAGTA